MAYYVRIMQTGDVGQVTEIDREAFSTQWPPPNYKRELQSNLSRYIVAVDITKSEEVVVHENTQVQGAKGIISRIGRRLGWMPAADPQLNKEYIVGFTGIWMIADEAHITAIAVREKYRGQGIGELLLIALIELAVKLKARIVTLEVRVSNVVAQSLYYKFGFTRVGLRRNYYTDNREDAILMSTQDINTPDYQEHFIGLKRDYLLTSKQILRENILSGQ